MNAQTIQVYLQAFLAVVGTLYVIASAVGRWAPADSKLGQFCRKFAADLKTVEDDAKKLEGAAQQVAGALPEVAPVEAPAEAPAEAPKAPDGK